MIRIGMLFGLIALGAAACERPFVAQPRPEAAAPVASAAAAPPTEAAAPEQPAGLPAEVVAFRKERDSCDHFRGEDPYDAERAAFLRAKLSQYCDGTDARLAALRRKYAGRADVVAVLAEYEDLVE